MSSFLGVLEFVLFCAVIVGVAASITWVVVRLTPSKRPGPSNRT